MGLSLRSSPEVGGDGVLVSARGAHRLAGCKQKGPPFAPAGDGSHPLPGDGRSRGVARSFSFFGVVRSSADSPDPGRRDTPPLAEKVGGGIGRVGRGF